MVATGSLLALAALTLGTVSAHGIFEKVLWSGKANAATRGSAGTKVTNADMELTDAVGFSGL